MIDSAASLDVLADGEIEIVGRILGSTNHAMFCRVTQACPPPEAPVVVDAIYKPIAGERPLDDFPDETLSRREVAAFLASEAIGWSIVPPTVLRDGPFGEGALQLWIDIDETVDVVAMVVGDDPRLRRIAVFDAAKTLVARNIVAPTMPPPSMDAETRPAMIARFSIDVCLSTFAILPTSGGLAATFAVARSSRTGPAGSSGSSSTSPRSRRTSPRSR
jgi:hypothetical protein